MGDKQKASLLEVKKPVSATSISTRADRVHGENISKSDILLVNNFQIYFNHQQTYQLVSSHHLKY